MKLLNQVLLHCNSDYIQDKIYRSFYFQRVKLLKFFISDRQITEGWYLYPIAIFVSKILAKKRIMSILRAGIGFSRTNNKKEVYG